MKRIDLLSLIDFYILEGILKSFHKLTGLSMGLTDNQGKQIIVVGNQRICEKFHRKNNLSLKNCIESDIYIKDQLITNKFVEYKCKNGLNDVAFPILVDNNHIGTLFFGQFFFEEEKIDHDYFVKQAEIFGYKKKDYLTALDQVPVYSRKKVNDILDFYKSLANSIINMAYSNLLLLEKNKKESDELLKKALDYNKKITEISPVGIVVYDKNGQIKFANSKAVKILGLKKSHITKLKYNAPEWKIKNLEGNDYPDYELPFARVMNEKKTVSNIQHSIEWPDGKTVYLSINASPIINENGEIDGVVSSLENISEIILREKDLKEINSFKDMIITNAAEGICVCHNRKDFPFINFTVWNNQMQNITGYTLDEINEIGWYQALYKDLRMREKVIKRITSLREGEDIVGEEWEITTKHNKKIVISISFSIIRTEKGITHVLALISDITQKNKHRELIEKHNDDLKNLNNTKDMFLSILSHDLRGPISSQMQLLNLVLNSYDKRSKDELQNYLYILSDNCKTSNDLLENILNWTLIQIGKTKTHIECCNLHEIFEETIEIYSGIIKRKEIDIKNTVKSNFLIYSDKNVLKTVLRNLISNALKFSNIGGVIIFSAKNKKDEVIVSVKDNGVGMNTHIKTSIFKKGETLTTNGTKNEKGTGLGLFICKDLLLSVNGKIWVESEENKGSCFQFSLPNNCTIKNLDK